MSTQLDRPRGNTHVRSGVHTTSRRDAYNTHVNTAAGRYSIDELRRHMNEFLKSGQQPFDTQATVAHDGEGQPVCVIEQQHVLELVPLNRRLHAYTGKWLTLLLELLWLAVLWLGVAGTIYVSGFDLYVQYFTNWMWTINAVYYTGDVLAFLDSSGRLQFVWVSLTFWPVFANNAQVFWLVYILICDNPDAIGEYVDEYGLCPVLMVDRFKHVLPFTIICWYAIMRRKDLVLVMLNVAKDGWEYVAAYIVMQLVFSHLILFGYYANFDFYAVYGVDLNIGIAIGVVELQYIVWLVLPIVLASPYMHGFLDSMYRFERRFTLAASKLAQKVNRI